MKLFNVVTIDNAIDIMSKNFKASLETETVNVLESLNRYLAQDIKSNINIPHFRKSLVDGYAVISKDIFLASESNPVPLKLIGESKMGNVCNIELEEETCVYVPTGGMVPYNAEGVVMIEYTEKLDNDNILIQKGISFNENIVEIGEDVKAGEELYKKGHKINYRDLGVLSGADIKDILVYKNITIGIISTGDEILSPEEEIVDAKIKDINTYILYGQLKELELKPLIYPPTKDNLEEIINLLEKASNECDIVLISGGSSVGKKDETLKAIESFENSSILVEGIAIKPGKPTIIGSINNKMVVGLPGHPLSCAFVVESVIKPFIKLLYNNKNNRYILCRFAYNYHKAKGREEYISVNIKEVNESIVCEPIFSKSSTIKNFATCDGYIRIDRDKEGLQKGELIRVYLF